MPNCSSLRHNAKLHFQLAISGLFFFQTSSTLWSIPTNQQMHAIFKNKINGFHNQIRVLLLPPSHTTFPLPLLRHHQLHLLFQTTTANISFLSSPASKHSALSIFATVNNTHQPSSFSALYKLLHRFHSDNLHSTSQSAPQRAILASGHTANYSYTLQDVRLHITFYCREVPPTPNFWLVGTHYYRRQVPPTQPSG